MCIVSNGPYGTPYGCPNVYLRGPYGALWLSLRVLYLMVSYMERLIHMCVVPNGPYGTSHPSVCCT